MMWEPLSLARVRPQRPGNGSRAAGQLRSAKWLFYLGSVVFVVAFAWILFNVEERHEEIGTTIPSVLIVLLIAGTWGRGPAVTAALTVSIMNNYLLVPPPNAFTLPTVRETVHLAGFLAVAVGLGTAVEGMKQAREEAKRLGASERFQKALLGSISHDLKTPLAGVIGSLSTLIEERALDEPARHELLTIAYRATKQLEQFVAHVLEMTRLESGDVRMQAEPSDLSGVLYDAVDHLRDVLDGRPCRVEVPPRLPAVHLDAILLPHALINVLDNAAKYSPPGTPIEITASAEGRDVVISVADRGIGIPAEHLHRVFEKFHRLRQPASTTGVIGGAGLGLPIAKGIVEAHGGAIWAEQRHGGGTIVKISLPLQRGRR
ncbi:MAG: PAS domain-containing sensor histidine kinase [Bacillati bacterium ANGP1]|uniref:histidine kinase n=1 Tax=Candidatus Segetimicrobium genomatis TaxID=2569760 RepID=A0A537M2V9_9BACT|nr:MAG: PAS domain-containing sensor histidine kinase [Terrabacteria group bacterium ANGP1]